jgi:hypothetical protein
MGVLPLNTGPSYLMTKKHARSYYLAINSINVNRTKTQILLEKEIIPYNLLGSITEDSDYHEFVGAHTEQGHYIVN